MFPSSPYGPDRSLSMAVLVLAVTLVLGAGGWYVLASLTTGLASEHGASFSPRSGGSAQRVVRAPEAFASRRSMRGDRARRERASSDPFGSGAPAWTGDDGGQDVPAPNPSESRYTLNADLDQAQLGSVPPTGGAGGGVSGSVGTSLSRTPPSGASMSAVHPFRSSYDASSETDAGWRSALSRLGGRLQALDGALARLDHPGGEGRAATSSSSSREGARTSKGAVTSARKVPDPPTVPIDDHVHWLLVAGLLWGVWRLSRG